MHPTTKHYLDQAKEDFTSPENYIHYLENLVDSLSKQTSETKLLFADVDARLEMLNRETQLSS